MLPITQCFQRISHVSKSSSLKQALKNLNDSQKSTITTSMLNVAPAIVVLLLAAIAQLESL